jgi:hypothetical protein
MEARAKGKVSWSPLTRVEAVRGAETAKTVRTEVVRPISVLRAFETGNASSRAGDAARSGEASRMETNRGVVMAETGNASS